MSATKQKQQARATKQRRKRREITFYSPSKNLRIVRIPIQHEVVNGVNRVAHQGVAYDFSPNGQCKAWEGDDELADGPRDEFGDSTTQDGPGFLRRHAWYADRFWEAGAEPGVAHPSLDDLVPRITAAAAQQDRERLRAIRTQEIDSHRRKTVLDLTDGALRALGVHVEPIEPAPGSGFPAEPSAADVQAGLKAAAERERLAAEQSKRAGADKFSSAPDQPHEPIGRPSGTAGAVLEADE